MRISHVRRKLNLTQRELANEMGLTINHISKLERCKTPLTKQTELALECLLRRQGLFGEEQQDWIK